MPIPGTFNQGNSWNKGPEKCNAVQNLPLWVPMHLISNTYPGWKPLFKGTCITLTVTIFWAGCKNRSTPLTHGADGHKVNPYIPIPWTEPGSNPPRQWFFGCWGEPQPQIPTSPILQGWNLGLHRSALKTYCKKIKKLLNSSFYKYHKSFKRRQYVGMEAVLASGGLW